MPRLLVRHAACLASMLMFFSFLAIAGVATAKKKALPVKAAVYTMPDAYSGMTYAATEDPGTVPWKQPVTCAPRPALPTWLKLDCSKSKFYFSGKVPGTTKDSVLKFVTAVVDDDPSHPPIPYTFILTLRPTVETVPMNEAAKKTENKTPQAPNYDEMKLQETSPIKAGIKEFAGQVLNFPVNTDLFLQVWTRPESSPTFPWAQVSMVDSSSSSSTATVQQVAIKDGKYDVKVTQRLSSGQILQLRIVDSKGNEVRDFKPQLLPSAITIDVMTLHVEPVSVGATTISGTILGMPMPADPYMKGSGTDLDYYGNIPGIVVWTSDADADPSSKLWSQAVPAITATPAKFVPVDEGGSFVVTLPSKLAAGQEVRVDIVPPPGRSFAQAGMMLPGLPAPPAALPLTLLSETITVVTDVALSTPTISSVPFTEGISVISGTATAPPSNVPLSVAVFRLKGQAAKYRNNKQLTNASLNSGPEEDVPDGVSGCLTIDDLDKFSENKIDKVQEFGKLGKILPLLSSASNTLLGTVDATSGNFKVTLAEALKEGDWIQIVQVLPAGTVLPDKQKEHCASAPRQVKYPFEFYRTNLTFVAGVLISNSSASSSSANFSQANQFYAFNADHAWRLPGYNCIEGLKWGKSEYGSCLERARGRSSTQSEVRPCEDQNQANISVRSEDTPSSKRKNDRNTCGSTRWRASLAPGIQSFFESRLTSIPVSTPSTSVTSTAASSTTTTATDESRIPLATTTTTTTPASTASPTLLTSQKVFRVATGAFLPWIIGHSSGEHPNGLFIAPLAKAGFDTVTGAGTSSNVVLPGGGPGTLAFQTAYKFYAYGARMGNMSLSQSRNRAPLIEHYLDVTFGRYSNLQSYVCHPLKPGITAPTPNAGSCHDDYPHAFPSTTEFADSRKQLYRIDLEGLVKIPVPLTAIPFYIGFNANIAQHTWQAEYLDHAYAPPDDIRILFGTKIDIGTLLTSLKLGTN